MLPPPLTKPIQPPRNKTPQDTYISLDDPTLVYYLALGLLALRRDMLLHADAGEVGEMRGEMEGRRRRMDGVGWMDCVNARGRRQPSSSMTMTPILLFIQIDTDSSSTNTYAYHEKQLPEVVSQIKLRCPEDIAAVLHTALEV